MGVIDPHNKNREFQHFAKCDDAGNVFAVVEVDDRMVDQFFALNDDDPAVFVNRTERVKAKDGAIEARIPKKDVDAAKAERIDRKARRKPQPSHP